MFGGVGVHDRKTKTSYRKTNLEGYHWLNKIPTNPPSNAPMVMSRPFHMRPAPGDQCMSSKAKRSNMLAVLEGPLNQFQNSSQFLLIERRTWSNFASTSSFSLTASNLCASATRNSSSKSRIYCSWSRSLLSSPGRLEMRYSICCSFVIRSRASSSCPAWNSSVGRVSTGGGGQEDRGALVGPSL